ncbi:hypothetical protein ONE63_001073 [Megalurothrips usitatus]|uniref:Uncharacterized protein n=1 Tax=Megalurothrips usitatus TaxID=439358 RepID=A0AAV7XFD0_9NEOP|nr:hypothetical protein ONE63_001073 [Megalurothrips usitatus]
MGATLLDLKENAKAKGIRRMPPNFATLLKQADKVKELMNDKPGDAQQEPSPTSAARNASITRSRKRRGMDVLASLESPKKAAVNTSSPIKVKSPGKSFVTSADLTHTTPSKEDVKDISPSKLGDASDDNSHLNETLPIADDTPIKKDTSTSGSDSSDSDSDSESDSSGDFSPATSDEDATSKLMTEIASLKAACKISDSLRRDSDAKILLLKEKVKLLQESTMETENLELKEKLKKLEELNRVALQQKSVAEINLHDLKSAVTSAMGILSHGVKPKPGSSTQSNAVRELFIGDDSLPTEVFSQPMVKSSPPKALESSLRNSKSSKMDSSQHESNAKRAASKSPSTSTKSPSASSKSPQQQAGLSRQEVLDISERVRKDILGEEQMETNAAGQIELGGIAISKDKWDKAIKVQVKNGLFVTKLSSAAYPTKYLQTRTVGKPKAADGNKKMATPRKVDAITACLRGKLLAENPAYPNVDKAAEAAKVILARKMQDAARPSSQAKKSKSEGKSKTDDSESNKKKKKKKNKKKSSKKD